MEFSREPDNRLHFKPGLRRAVRRRAKEARHFVRQNRTDGIRYRGYKGKNYNPAPWK